MMKFIRAVSVFFAGLILCRSLPSCVKEDRTDCPCILVLDFSQTELVIGESLRLEIFHEGKTLAGSAELDSLPGLLYLPVPRGHLQLAIFKPAASLDDVGKIEIPYGEQCPELWTDFSDIVAGGESVTHVVRLHKNYCTLNLTVNSSDGDKLPLTGYLGLSYEIQGEICGCDLRGDLVPGPFAVGLSSGLTAYVANVPRQKDSSLMLNVYSGGRLVRAFALGEYMAKAGYDWSAEDLEDAWVEIDYTGTSLVLRLGGWSDTEHYETVI